MSDISDMIIDRYVMLLGKYFQGFEHGLPQTVTVVFTFFLHWNQFSFA